MFRKMYQGGSLRKQEPRLAMRDADDEPPRDAPVRPCEWPSEDFMDRAGIKEEFNASLRNADLVSFEAEKCRQYHYLTSSFVRRFEFSSSRNSQTILFDLMKILTLWTQRTLPLLANFHNGVVLVNLANMSLEIFLLV